MRVTAKKKLVFGVVAYKPGDTFVIPERNAAGDDVPRWKEGPLVPGVEDGAQVPKSWIGKPMAFNADAMVETPDKDVTPKGRAGRPLVTDHEPPAGTTAAVVAAKVKADAAAPAVPAAPVAKPSKPVAQ